MTRAEAANILSNDIIDGHVEGNARFMDAFWFAVDNLKAEPCEDAVSREDTCHLYCQLTCGKDYCTEPCSDLKVFWDLPSVQPTSTPCEYAEDCKKMKFEPCDAVSREAVLQGMYDLCNTGETLKENPWRDNPHIDAIIDTIENLPSVQPERVKGEWIDVTKKIGFPEDMCSECHLRASRWMRFCPNCGADMRGGE